MTGRWWRRNWWAVAAVLPLLLAVFLVSPDDSFRRWRDAQPGDVIAPGPDGWVDYAGIRLRLREVTPTELRDRVFGEPFAVPDGLTAWRATLAFTAHPDPEAIVGCEFELEDVTGRRFGAGPAVLEGAEPAGGAPYSSAAGCSPATAQESPNRDDTFLTTLLFAMPSTADPAGLRLSAFDELPRYVWWEVPEGGGTG